MQKPLEQTVQADSSTTEAEQSQGFTPQEFISPQIPPAADADVIAYLHYSAKFAEIAAAAERDALILATCEQLGITVSDEEWQAGGDAFRQEHKLWGR
jgi:zona occludens toxin (predicted ATPase)